MRSALPILLVAAAGLVAVQALSCMDDSGNPVDWFTMFKYSKSASYSYADANQASLQTSPHAVNDSSAGAIANTIIPMLSQSFAFYNDEPPTGEAPSTFGHTKGILGLSDDATTGVWIVHSVPKFPSRTGSTYDGYPDSGIPNGQSFACLSLSGPEFESVAALLLLTRPKVYDVQFSSTVESKLPELADVCENGAAFLPAASNITKLTTVGGAAFTYFAKNAAWGLDLYGNLIGPTYKTDLWVQTWQDGAGPLPNFCTPTHPYNTLNIESYEINGVTVKNTEDHSKWAIMIGQDDVCVGGINRMTSQEGRPGGSMCFVSAAVNSMLQANAVTYSTPPKGACG